MVEIKFVGVDGLDAEDSHVLQARDYAEKFAHRYSQMLNNDLELVLHTKSYQKSGDRRKFAVNAKISYPGGTMNSAKDAWELPIAVRVALQALESQMKSRFQN